MTGFQSIHRSYVTSRRSFAGQRHVSDTNEQTNKGEKHLSTTKNVARSGLEPKTCFSEGWGSSFWDLRAETGLLINTYAYHRNTTSRKRFSICFHFCNGMTKCSSLITQFNLEFPKSKWWNIYHLSYTCIYIPGNSNKTGVWPFWKKAFKSRIKFLRSDLLCFAEKISSDCFTAHELVVTCYVTGLAWESWIFL